MKYVTLERLYYGDKAEYQKVYQERFNSENTIKLNFYIKNHQAFFMQTPYITHLFFDTLRTDKHIAKLCSELPSSAITQFAYRCLIDEILVTNKIEGVYSTRKEVSETLLSIVEKENDSLNSHKRFWGLTAKYAKLGSNDLVSLNTAQDIRSLYNEIVLPEVIDEDPSNNPDGKIFRKDSASVKTSTDKEIHRGIYPESKIIEAVESALGFLNDKSIEPFYRICIFHYLLEYIHPFYDGNGRLGRFIVSQTLSKELTSLISYRISTTITENINLYYAAFKTCNNPHNLGDLTPFLLMMAEMLNISIHHLSTALENRLVRVRRYEEFIPELPYGTDDRLGNLYTLLIQAGLFSEKGLTYNYLSEVLHCSYGTVRKDLKKIDSSKYLIKKREGNRLFFMADIDKLDDLYLPKNDTANIEH